MFKNLYHSDEYKLKNTPYKLRGVFLSKRNLLDKEKEEKKKREITPEQKLAMVKQEIEELEEAIKHKQADVESLQQQYTELVGKADADISEMMEKAQKEADELKEQKEKQGYEEGFDKGYYDGIEKGKSEMEQKFSGLISTMESVTNSALEEKHKIINATEEDIVGLSAGIARKVVDQELSVNKDVIVNFVKEAIKKLEDKEKIIIYANPDDIELIKSHREDFKELVDTADTLHILPDELLEKGECRLESKNEIIDTDLNYQFGEIRKKLHTDKD